MTMHGGEMGKLGEPVALHCAYQSASTATIGSGWDSSPSAMQLSSRRLAIPSATGTWAVVNYIVWISCIDDEAARIDTKLQMFNLD